VPLSPRIPITERVERLIGNPIFQRLRGVRQLALAHVIYPGALHSRFEHSLGVFQRATCYINALWAQADCDVFRTTVDERGIAALLVAALLHDCGQYPMAHCFEELISTCVPEEVLKNDKIVVRMLRGQLPGVASTENLTDLNETLGLWGVEVEDVLAILTGYQNVSKALDPSVVAVLHSILHGPLGADKLDSVQRDSLHTGNPAGQAVDEDRLIESLVLRTFNEGLGIHERGLHASQALFDAHINMFTNVYWHRVNRAVNHMFTEALSLFTQSNVQRFQQAFDAEFFRLDDEAMLKFVAENIPERARKHLIEPLLSASGGRRNVYRRVVTISASPGSVEPLALQRNATEPHGQICQMYDWYLQGNDAAPKWKRFEHEARERTRKLAGVEVPLYEILVDIPDIRFGLSGHNNGESLNNLLVYGQGDPISIRLKDSLFGEKIDGWRMYARKVRIFASPSVATALAGREKELSENIFELTSQVFNGPA
jgi:HD superfamily phosphohydrolase